MNLPFFIAKRYLFSKKSKNAVNLISLISVLGVMIGTMALVIVISAFNGIEGLVGSMYSSFDPDVRVFPAKGKVFKPKTKDLDYIKDLKELKAYSLVLEENVMLRYADHPRVVSLRGVDENYVKVCGIDSLMIDGKFDLWEKGHPKLVVGLLIAQELGMGLSFIKPAQLFVPKRGLKSLSNPDKAFKKSYLFLSGFFNGQREFSAKFIYAPLSYTRDLLDYTDEISFIDIRLSSGEQAEQVRERLQAYLGDSYLVKTQYELNEALFKMMKVEKLAIFIILTLILFVAAFNILGSLSMLILEKKKDVSTLSKLGASDALIKRIFLYEGFLISLSGTLIGFCLGILVCWIQQAYGVVSFGQSGGFAVQAYPVKLVVSDLMIIFPSILLIGFFTSWYPVYRISARILRS